jgi:ATP-dependent 26S proteasome regulatory subunit
MTANAPRDLARDRAQMIRALARLAELLGAHAAGTTVSVAPLELDDQSALARLCATFGLSPFERDVLTLAAAPELDGSFPALFAQASGDPARAFPTLSFALAALPNPAWSALLPDGPLRWWRLIEVDGGSLTGGVLRADEAIVHTLLGFGHTDRRLQPFVTELAVDDVLSDAQDQFARAIAERCLAQARPRLQLVSPDRALGRALADRIASALGRRGSLVRFQTLPANVNEIMDVVHLWERDLALRGGFAVLECEDGEEPQRERLLHALVERVGMPLLLLAPTRLPLADAGVAAFEARRPMREEQATRWAVRLGREELGRALSAQFDVGLSTIDATVAAVPADADAFAIADALRAQLRPRLDALAERLDTGVRWRDLVLPTDRRRVLRAIVDHVRHRDRVFREWGYGADDESGRGLTVLFSGPSGTGKSLAARVLANVLRLDLYRVDLASVFSKYIGETEKNLRRLFDAAEGGGIMLLFDEADALFGKRSEVKDSHDRHANVEVSYLLQRLERFNGVAVLTTNLREAFDAAFLRRFQIVLEFPFPDAALRERIWRHAFPRRAPIDQLDYPLLAKLPIPGGNIHNIVLNAGVSAAARNRAIGMEDVAVAVRAEYAKLDRVAHDPALMRWLEGVPTRSTRVSA